MARRNWTREEAIFDIKMGEDKISFDEDGK